MYLILQIYIICKIKHNKMNALLIAGIICLIVLGVVVIITPYYWCKVAGGETSLACCCLPFFIVAILLSLGVGLTVFGSQHENQHRLRHM